MPFSCVTEQGLLCLGCKKPNSNSSRCLQESKGLLQGAKPVAGRQALIPRNLFFGLGFGGGVGVGGCLGCFCCMWKFSGYGLNLHHSMDPSCCSDNARILNPLHHKRTLS